MHSQNVRKSLKKQLRRKRNLSPPTLLRGDKFDNLIYIFNMNSFQKIFLALFLSIFSANSAWAFGQCSDSIPAQIGYAPALDICGGTAAIILGARYRNAFSAVVRDCNNNDRDPCHTAVDSCPTNASSPYKTQKKFSASVLFSRTKKPVPATINCLREPGSSSAFVIVRRMTIKLRNPAGPNDILKLCLHSRTKTLHSLKIISASQVHFSANSGAIPFCLKQGYLNCDYSYQAICPKY